MRGLVLVLLCLIPAGALASPEFPNEPAGSTTLLNCAFNDITCGGQILNTYNSGTITQPSPAGSVSPSNALTSSLFPCKGSYTNPPPPALGSGCSGGGEWLYPPNAATARPIRDLFVGLVFMMNPGFEQNSVGTNKVFFMRAHNWRFTGSQTNGYFAVRGAANNLQLIFSHNTGTLNNAHVCAQDLGLTCFPNTGNTVTLVRGVQYKIEAYIHASTTPTSRDGILRVYINGILTHNYTNLNYGTGIVNEALIGQTWDGAGNGCCPTVPWHFYFDHFYVSASNCPAGGCGGGPITPNPPPPPPIPAAPSDLRFGFLGDLYAWLRWLNG